MSLPGLGLLIFLFPAGSDHARDVGEHERSSEHQPRPQPVIHGERVLEVDDREDEAEELAESDHQGDGQAGALCGEDEHGGDADILGDHIAQEVEQHHGDPDPGEEREGDRGAGQGQAPVVADVGAEQQEAGEGQGVRVEQGLLGMFAILAINNLTNVLVHITGTKR